MLFYRSIKLNQERLYESTVLKNHTYSLFRVNRSPHPTTLLAVVVGFLYVWRRRTKRPLSCHIRHLISSHIRQVNNGGMLCKKLCT